MTVAEYIEHLAEERIIRPNTVANWRTASRNFALTAGNPEISDIGKKDIRQWVEALRRQHITANTANAYMRCLRSVYNKYAEESGLTSPNPFRHAMIRPEETVKRALNGMQMQQLMAMRLPPRQAWAREVFLLCFMLRGISPVDLWALRPKDIVGGMLSYRRSKTGRLIQLRVEPEAASLLTKLGFADGSPRSFEKDRWNVNHHLRTIGRKMGLPFGLTLYCARHTWATAAQRKGYDLAFISSAMGHADMKTTQIYLAGLETSKMDRWGRELIDDLMGIG